MQRLRFAESAANNDGAKLSAKRFVDLLEQEAADAEAWPAFRQRLVDADEELENSAFSRRQRIETRLQSFLQVFQNQWNETHISDFVFRKSFAHVFGTQSSQMHDRRAAREWPEKTNHEIDGMICRQNAEVAHARPKRIKRCERNALLKIVFVRHHAALGAAARPRGVDNACRVLTFTRDENRFAVSAKFFPALCAGEVGVGWRFRDQNGSNV